MNSHSPCSFSHLRECCWTMGQATASLTYIKRPGIMKISKQEYHSLGIFCMMSWNCCAASFDDFNRNLQLKLEAKHLAFYSNEMPPQQHSIISIKLRFQEHLCCQRSKNTVNQFLALPSFSKSRSFDPENEMSTPLWKHCRRLSGDIRVSNSGVKSRCGRPREWFYFNHVDTSVCIHMAFQSH